MPDRIRAALNEALSEELAAALGRIAHCAGQLSAAQLWSRSAPEMNSIGNLMLHLAGNLRQLIVSGLGAEPDDRDRPAEFAERGPIPTDELLGKLFTAVKEAQNVIHSAPDEALFQAIPVKRFDWTGMQALVRCIAHFRGHAQEIIHMTRELLGEKYAFAGMR